MCLGMLPGGLWLLWPHTLTPWLSLDRLWKAHQSPPVRYPNVCPGLAELGPGTKRHPELPKQWSPELLFSKQKQQQHTHTHKKLPTVSILVKSQPGELAAKASMMWAAQERRAEAAITPGQAKELSPFLPACPLCACSVTECTVRTLHLIL